MDPTQAMPPEDHRHSNHQNPASGIAVGLCGLAAALCLSAGVRLSVENQLMLSAAGLGLLGLSGFLRRFSPDLSRLMLILTAAFLSLRYWLFRSTETIGTQDPWGFGFVMLLYLAETYGILIHFLGMFVNIAPLTRSAPRMSADPEKLPTVDVFIPTYDEPLDIVRVTATACTQLDYPEEKLNIYILDDGGTDLKRHHPDPLVAAAAGQRTAALKSMADQLGLRYLTRATNEGAKAGNITAGLLACGCADEPEPKGNKTECVNFGFGRSCGELVLVLDCDHVPTRDFLQSTVSFFLADDNLFLVQTPHFFINPTPIEKNLKTRGRSPSENEMFYGGVHPGLDFWNASFFCGSGALMRRKHLMEIGGLAGDTVTEDAETSLALHARGHRSIYLNKPMLMGLSPESFEDFIGQRRRWAQGMVQILLLKNPMRQKGLRPTQRICYLNSCLFWLFGFARIVFFASPLLFLFFGLKVYNASLVQVLLYAAPHLAASYAVVNRVYGKLRHPFFSELFETIQSVFLVPAIVSVFMNPRKPTFKVTPKTATRPHDALTPLAAPFYVMFLLALAGFPAGFWRLAQNPMLWDTVLVCLIWNTFNIVLALCCLGVVWERRQVRSAHRYETREPAVVRGRNSGKYAAVVVTDISNSGVGLVARSSHASRDDRLVLEAADSSGHTYALPIRVRRRKTTPEGTVLGCEFEAESEAERRQVIAFMYGDSRRWKYFHETGHGGALGTVRGLVNLLGIGARGAVTNGSAIIRILLDIVLKIKVTFKDRSIPAKRREPEYAPFEGSTPHRPVDDAVADDGHRGRTTDSPAQTRTGSGPPSAGHDGQHRLHDPGPPALERAQRKHPLHLR